VWTKSWTEGSALDETEPADRAWTKLARTKLARTKLARTGPAWTI
jgi:hypothetical protein